MRVKSTFVMANW